MYIGVHTPLDVFVSVAIAILLIVILKPLMFDRFHSTFPYVFAGMLAISLSYLCFVEFYQFPADVDVLNLASGRQNAYTLFGCLIGLLIVYIADEKWLHFPTKAVWWAQVLKVAGGLALVLAVKSGLKAPLNALLGESFGRALRYMLVVLVAGLLWPLTFRFFKKLGANQE
jgi:hypothetical protein